MLQLLLLTLATSMLYGSFLANPLVFDDLTFFQVTFPELQPENFRLELRYLPSITFKWVHALPGENLQWWRLGNLALHITNSVLLFLLLRKLFAAALAGENSTFSSALSLPWLAFFGALIFALHPVSVYGVAYLVQRTSLMATLFTLLTWLLFSAGVLHNKQKWLLISAITYLLAVLSKEHAIMAPAVCVALLWLLCKPDRALLARVGPTFLLYGMVALFAVYQIKGLNILGHAYEPNATALLSQQGIDPSATYPLSILTQSFLYFKYLWLWLLPIPAWMSVDMPADFAAQFWIWPQTAGLIGFVLYPIIATHLLLNRGRNGLLGFALLGPWLLFATEFSTVRVQEIFVLYRSYLWMPCLFAALPFLLQKMPAKFSATLLVAITISFIPATWNRLAAFSGQVQLWGDALRYAQKNGDAVSARIYRNLGAAYRENGQHIFALENFNMVIQLYPNANHAYLDRAQLYEEMGNPMAAMRDYAQGCQRGVAKACAKFAQ